VTAPAPKRRRWPRILLITLGCLIAAFALWIWFAGRFLVRSDPPIKADAVVILSGDPLGNRLRAGAATMVATGSGRLVVFIPSDGELYDLRPAALRYLARLGISRDQIRFLPAGSSTADEAGVFAAYANACGWTTIDVATSPFHTRRTGLLFGRALGGDVTLAVVPSNEPYDAAHWWRTSTDRESTLTEWVKLAADAEYLVSKPTGGSPDARC